MRYTIAELERMPLTFLRAIDIKNGEEEAIVQKIVNKKLAQLPPENPYVASTRETDSIKTVEQEKVLQAKMDAENAKRKAMLTADESIPDSKTFVASVDGQGLETALEQAERELEEVESEIEKEIKEKKKEQEVTIKKVRRGRPKKSE